MTETRLMTLDEVAEALRLSPHTIRSFVRKGKLRPVRICRRLLFAHADVERLLVGGGVVERSRDECQQVS